jgi:internalin A
LASRLRSKFDKEIKSSRQKGKRIVSHFKISILSVFAGAALLLGCRKSESRIEKPQIPPNAGEKPFSHPKGDNALPSVVGAQRFLDLCQSSSLSQEARNTLDVLLKEVAKTSECKLASQRLDGLRSLTIRGKGISDLTPISTFWNLKELDLSDNNIENLTPLSNIRPLDKLFLRNNRIVDVTPLARLDGLRDLHLSRNQIADAMPLGQLTSVERLYLESNRIEDVSFVKRLTKLSKLNLSGNLISTLDPFVHLQIHKIKESDRGVKVAPLTDLDLARNRIAELTPLRALTELRVLALEENRIAELTELSTCVNLRSLTLAKNSLADANALSALSQLETLDLSENELGAAGDSSLTQLSRLSNLTYLNLANNPKPNGSLLACPISPDFCFFE